MVLINYLNLNQHKQVQNEAKKVNTGLNIRWHMGLFTFNSQYKSNKPIKMAYYSHVTKPTDLSTRLFIPESIVIFPAIKASNKNK